jgi:predicted ATPase/class 3 adenylate cyclase
MADLPTGTVTFLFSDVEGSTRLVQERSDASDLLEAHGRLIREAASSEGGVEVNTEGDSFFLVFTSPAAAVRAAAGITRSLHEHGWPEDAPVRVRIGLHTGEGTLGARDYVGLDVHRAARIAGAGHGGQVLLSETTRSLTAASLPNEASLRDLGPHRLKDLERPEHLFQLVLADLPSDFPPPRTLDARPNNLPAQLTSFVGRGEELGDVTRLLGRTRLLTLTGPGGTGKTRLSLEVAARRLLDHADGVFFVELGPITDPSLVPSTIAGAMGVPEEAGRPVLDTLRDHLRDRDLLLVLDNFEQVVEAAPMVEELLAAAPGLTVMATSRVVLSVRGEQEYPVPPLHLPDPARLPSLAALSQYEAVKLFIDRGMAVKPDFDIDRRNAPAVAEICARLDGLPLAIELAASRVKILEPDEMLPRLESRLSLLTGGARSLPERQRTLRGAIAWSYDLLGEPERVLFARLGVFVGGCTIESAEAVCDPNGELGLDVLDGMASLVDKSLLRRTESADGEPRFGMLETIREFAVEALEAQGDAQLVRGRHADRFFSTAREAEPHLTAEDQQPWLDRLDRERDNLRAAFRWATASGRTEEAQDVAGRTWRFWQQRGHLAEARMLLEHILRAPGGEEVTASRTRALTAAGSIAYWQNDYQAARAYYEEEIAAARALGDDRLLAEALHNMGFIPLIVDRDIDAALPFFEETLALARRIGEPEFEGRAQEMIAYIKFWKGDPEGAIPLLEDGLRAHRRSGRRFLVADSLTGVAGVYTALGRLEEAEAAEREALRIFQDAGNPTGMAMALHGMAMVAAGKGRYRRAARLAGASARLRAEVGGGAPPEITSDFGDPVAEAREHLDDETFQQSWQDGYAMDMDKAYAYALDEAAD